jgi:hypothetical protein
MLYQAVSFDKILKMTLFETIQWRVFVTDRCDNGVGFSAFIGEYKRKLRKVR